MQEIINSIIDYFKMLELSSPFIGVFIGFSVIVLESIFPVLPLAAFIALNMMVFGNVFGFVLSWVATVCGCTLAFFICRKGFSVYLYHKIENKPNIETVMNKISSIKLSTLVLIMALPFTPAFSINIAAGLSKISFKKFITAVLISKLAIVYFWGYIGTTLLESITDPLVILKIAIILIIVYIISLLVNEKFDIER